MSSGPAHRVQSAVVEYGFPQGHLGHLSVEEEAALDNFKVLCSKNGFYKPGNGSDESASHEDATLLRFLRARQFVVPDAFQQFSETEEWRKANELDQLYETIDLEQYDETRRLYPQWTGRRDRRGIPVYVFEVSYLTGKRMAAYERSTLDTHTKFKTDGKTPGKLLRLFALYENLTRFVMPLCTALTDREHPRTPISQSNNIVDISGVGLKQFWNLRTHMQDASTLATAHYPETLDRIFIVGAPGFFPTVWGWIKKWFDPITTSKIFIISHNDVKSTLESFIEPHNIPKKYGGTLEFEFGDLPALDPALEAVTSWNTEAGTPDFPHGPMYWVNSKDEESIQAIAVGSDGAISRREEVCLLKKAFKDIDNKRTIPQDAIAETATISAEKSAIAAAAGTDPFSIASQPADQPAEHTFQNGELISEPRPELETFHTAQDEIATLNINDETTTNEPISNGVETTEPQVTAAANQLDPNVNTESPAKVAQPEEHKTKVSEDPQSPVRVSMTGTEDSGSVRAGSEKGEEKKEKRKTLLGGLKGKFVQH